MVVEIKFKTEAYFTAIVELSEHQIKAFEKHIIKDGWIGGNEPKAKGFRRFFIENSEFDYIDTCVDIEDATMLRLPYYPWESQQAEPRKMNYDERTRTWSEIK